MPKRARYDGPDLEVAVYPPGDIYAEPIAIVQKGHMLPADAPAAIRDELLARDNWTEVEQPAPQGQGKKED